MQSSIVYFQEVLHNTVPKDSASKSILLRTFTQRTTLGVAGSFAFFRVCTILVTVAFGTFFTTSLKSLGRGTSGKEHRQLHDEIERLVTGTVKVRNTKRKMEYIGHLIDKAVQDETKRHWVYGLNPDLRTFYSPDAYTLIDWEKRQHLSGKDLARWLQ